jgi:parallel beta helix pectate lyase-like protein/copper-binding protein NosD
VAVLDNSAPSTQGVGVSGSSNVQVKGNDFYHSISAGLIAFQVAGLVVTENNFTHAGTTGFVGQTVSSFYVQNNSFDIAGDGQAVILSNAHDGNLSSNNLNNSNYSVQVLYSTNITLWDNTVSPGTPGPYIVNFSNDISIVNSAAVNPGTAAAFLYSDVGVTLLRDNFAGSGDGVNDEFSSSVRIEYCRLGGGSNGVYSVGGSGLWINGSNLALANNGLFADGSSGIVMQDSNLSRANYPLNLTGGTRDVLVTGSDLNGAQIGGAYINNASGVTINDSKIESPAQYGITSIATDGLTVSSTDLSSSPIRPGGIGVATTDDTGVVLSHDQIRWTRSPFVDMGSTGLQITATDFSNATGGSALSLYGDDRIVVNGSNFFNATDNGISAASFTNLSITDSAFGQIGNDGLILNAGTDTTITGNNFDNEGGLGVYSAGTNGLLASGNQLSNDSYAFFLNGGINAVIVGNTALNDRDGGLSASAVYGLDVAGNNISFQAAPDLTTIDLLNVNGFAVTGNHLFQDNQAVLVAGFGAGTIVGNEFVFDNVSVNIQGQIQAQTWHNDFVSDARWLLNNTPALAWDNGYPIGGNFWSNYTGTDSFSGPQQNIPGADGIGDQPLVLVASDIDRYPLMTAWSTHAAMFTETGLPSGTSWTVVFNGTTYQTTSSAITVVSSVGVWTDYAFSIPTVGNYTPSPPSGSGVLGPGLIQVAVRFAVPTYSLTFTETGLPSGTSLAVTVGGVTTTSSNGSISVSLANGTYNFSVTPVPGFDATPRGGDVTISGGPRAVFLTFVAHTYDVTIYEAGLPNGTRWSVTVDGSSFTSTTGSMSFALANGSYTFAVAAAAGYALEPSGRSWNVSGGPMTVYLTFTTSSQSSTPGGPLSASNPGLLPYYVAIGVLAVLATVGWILTLRRRRRGGPGDPSSRAAPPAPPPPAP